MKDRASGTVLLQEIDNLRCTPSAVKRTDDGFPCNHSKDVVEDVTLFLKVPASRIQADFADQDKPTHDLAKNLFVIPDDSFTVARMYATAPEKL
jgi:hypothetical protein